MARKYPRFLFSNPTNTKSEGPFIVHLLYPKCIFKVTLKGGVAFDIEFLEWLEDAEPASTGNISPQLRITWEVDEWLFKQLLLKQITI